MTAQGMQAAAIEAEALRALANQARFEAAMMGASDGSMSAQKAACLEWVACGAEYQLMLRGGPPFDACKLLAADAAKEQDLRGYYPMAARVLADEVRRLKAGQAALAELVAKTGELIEHLQKTGRLAPCFNLPALDEARELTRKT